MDKVIPEIIKQNGFDFNWDDTKVWQLEVPAEDMEVSELEWIMDMPFWSDGKGWYNLTARNVLNNPDKYQEHMKRIKESNTNHPIDIMKNLQDNWLILDGLHRLARLVMEGNSTVKVRKISRDLIPYILKTN